MARINFPSSPVIGQTHQVGDTIYKWTGQAWITDGSSPSSIYDELQPDPAFRQRGDMWIKESTKDLYVFDGVSWVLAGGSSFTGDGVLTSASVDTETDELVLNVPNGPTPEIRVDVSVLKPNIAFPEILSVEFENPYPLGVTSLYAGRTVNIRVTLDSPCFSLEIQIDALGNSNANACVTGTSFGPLTPPAPNGEGNFEYVITGTIKDNGNTQTARSVTIGGLSPSNIPIPQKNSAELDAVNGVNTVLCDNISAQINSIVVTYTPPGQNALKGSEQAVVTYSTVGADSVAYLYPTGQLTEISTGSGTVTVQRNSGNYNDSVTNLIIRAVKVANGKITEANVIVNISNVAPIITIDSQPIAYTSDIPSNIHAITFNSTQNLIAAPVITVPHGSLSVLAGSGKVWSGTLTITDGNTQGTHSMTVVSANNGALVATTTPTIPYRIEGFEERFLLIPQQVRLSDAIGVNIINYLNVTITGLTGEIWTFQADKTISPTPFEYKYTITDAGENVDLNGEYIWWAGTASEIGGNTAGKTIKIKEIPQ